MEPPLTRSFAALADPTRRNLFERLVRRPFAVGELAAGLTVSRPAVSQHLKVLKSAGLIRVRREGTRQIYQADPAGVAAMRRYLDGMWDEALSAFRALAEKE